MSWFHEKPLGTITLADIERLVELKVRESRVIDFKKGPTLDKLSIAKDLASFANAQGGDLVYGVDEQDLIATEVVGFDEKVEATAKRILDVACDCIEPRIRGLGFQPVELPSGKYVLVARVPQSLDAPHRVELNEDRFWVRDDTAQHRMSSSEIKALVTRMMTFQERAEAWRAECFPKHFKLLAIEIQTFFPVLVVHGVPLYSTSARLDLRGDAVQSAMTAIRSVPNRPIQRRLEGASISIDGQDDYRVVQWLRDGRFEVASSLGLPGEVGSMMQKKVYPPDVEEGLLEALKHARAIEGLLGKTSWMFLVTLVGVAQAAYVTASVVRPSQRGCTFDRHNIPVPPAFAEELPSTPEAVKAFWSDTLDIIAQSANLPEHPRS